MIFLLLLDLVQPVRPVAKLQQLLLMTIDVIAGSAQYRGEDTVVLFITEKS